MKNVRVWFEKDGECRFISHLDLNRVMLRAIQKSRVPVWHTEGFNPHPFVTFALPLPLGVRGKNESMDFRLIDEDFEINEIPEKLNACLPFGIRVFSASEPVMKPGDIAFARFNILLSDDGLTAEELHRCVLELLNRNEIIVPKKTKSGVKDIDLKPKIGEYSVTAGNNAVRLDILLPAGSSENVSPMLITGALDKYCDIRPYADITREALFDTEMRKFT